MGACSYYLTTLLTVYVDISLMLFSLGCLSCVLSVFYREQF